MKDTSASLMKKGTKTALALAVSMTVFLNAALASSAVTLASPNPQAPGHFGESVAISGTTLVVGAPDETGGGYPLAGHAYIIDTTTDPLTITLTSPDADTNGRFGESVAVSGTTLVVGAPDETASGPPGSGNAYIFDAASGSLVWTLTSPNPGLNGRFGQSVAISGTTVVVGAPREHEGVKLNTGNAYVFDATSGSLIHTLTSPNAETHGNFGHSVAVSGTTVVVGAQGETASMYTTAGNAYIFDAESGSLIHTLKSDNARLNGNFGLSVAISGTTVSVGAPGETAGVLLGAGNAYIFDAESGSLVSTLTSPNAEANGGFGFSVAISCTTVVVGAHHETAGVAAGAGHAYTFDATTGTSIATLTSPYAQSDGEFGWSVAISEGDPTEVVGAPEETANGQVKAGHAYLFLI